MQDIKDRVAKVIELSDFSYAPGLPDSLKIGYLAPYALEMAELIKELTEREVKLVEALKFYADGDYQEGGGVGGNKANNFEIDYGQIATKRLKELGY